MREPKSWLKFNVQKTKNRATGLITSWQIAGGKVAWHSAAHGAVQSQTPLVTEGQQQYHVGVGQPEKWFSPKLLNIEWGYVSSLFMDHSLLTEKGLAQLNEAMSHVVQGHPRWMGYSDEF